MKKHYITYSYKGKIKKAVLDENLFRQYSVNPDISDVVEYDTEILLEKKYAEAIGVNGTNKKFLLG